MLHKPIKKAWLLYVCLLTLMAGCSKCNKVITPNDVSSLPAATQIGANTFGCMLNGNLWVAQGSSGSFNPARRPNPYLGYDATFEGGQLDLGGGPKGSSMKFTGINIGNVGKYKLNNNDREIAFDYYDEVNIIKYYNDGYEGDIANGELTITKLDKVNKIISGTFYITIEKPKLGKKIVITEGRFDMKYL